MEKEASIVTVLVPAAGQGTRLGGMRKQYRELDGEPLLVRTLRRFEEAGCVDHMVVAAPESDMATVARMLAEFEIRKMYDVVPGGLSRQASVAAALDAAPADTDVVLVHDAVRPFVPDAAIYAVVRAAHSRGAASVAVRATDTLRRGDDGFFGETVDRADLFQMQTPQAFRCEWFMEAHRLARENGYTETDDVALVQRIGRRVALVEGSRLNIKVTTPDDWVLAQALWSMQPHNGSAPS